MTNGKPLLAFRQRHLELIRKIEKSGSLKLLEAMQIRAKLQRNDKKSENQSNAARWT